MARWQCALCAAHGACRNLPLASALLHAHIDAKHPAPDTEGRDRGTDDN